MSRIPWRWIAIAVFVLSSSLNYLDRQIIASLPSTLKQEFSIDGEQFGLLISAFSIVYALSSPFTGLLIDRVGLNKGSIFAVAGWSAIGILTGMVGSFQSLLLCRGALGAAEAAGIPSTGKANATYLRSHELAFGTAINNVGLTIGGIGAPLLVAFLGGSGGENWRRVFVVAGLLGFVWIPVWLFVSSRAPKETVTQITQPAPVFGMLRDQRFWGLVVANLLYMTMYTLWTNWTPRYFVQDRGLLQNEANRLFAWIPPIFATLGGFTGGALAFRLIRSGKSVFRARIRVCLVSAIMLLATATVPMMPTAGWAAAAISFSFYWTLVMSTNVYAMPIDYFGPGRAAFGVSALTFAYGIMQAVVSPVIGKMTDSYGWQSVCSILSVMPLLAVGVLWVTAKDRS